MKHRKRKRKIEEKKKPTQWPGGLLSRNILWTPEAISPNNFGQPLQIGDVPDRVVSVKKPGFFEIDTIFTLGIELPEGVIFYNYTPYY